jgi:hypothetical protein
MDQKQMNLLRQHTRPQTPKPGQITSIKLHVASGEEIKNASVIEITSSDMTSVSGLHSDKLGATYNRRWDVRTEPREV